MYHSSLNVFMMNNMPSGMKSNEQKVARWPKRFFFFFEVSQGGLNQSLKNYGFIKDAIFTCTCAQIT